MKKIIIIILLGFGMATSAQVVDVFAATARVDIETAKLSRLLLNEVMESKRPFINYSCSIVAGFKEVTASFKHRGKVFLISGANDIREEASITNASYLTITVIDGQKRIYFSDHMLNGSWDEYQEGLQQEIADYVDGGDFDRQKQKQFKKLLNEALGYFK